MALNVVHLDDTALFEEAKRLSKGFVEYEIQYGPEAASLWLYEQGGKEFPDRRLLNAEILKAKKRHGWS